jgi:nucleoside 2-deoxyribosyltransferase
MNLYLAGPEVFLPDANRKLEEMKIQCKQKGLIGLSPFDSILNSGEKGIPQARKIFQGNIKLIQESDIVVANCNPFRGAVVDDGTAFEIGYGFALGKKIFGYIDKKKSLPEIVKNKIKTLPHSSGYAIDEDGYLVNEDFGNTVNLMLEFSIEKSGGKLVEGNFLDCLDIIIKGNI